MFKSLLADHVGPEEQHFLFSYLQFIVGRTEMFQQDAVG